MTRRGVVKKLRSLARRFSVIRPLLFVVMFATVGTLILLAAHALTPSDLPANEHARGLIYDGLVKIKKDNPTSKCKGDYSLKDNPNICTHGPDPGPAGHDVRVHLGPKEIEANDVGGGKNPNPIWPLQNCGTDGKRVEGIYVYTGTNNFGQFEKTFNDVAGRIEYAVSKSARDSGGDRHVRFATTPGCALVINQVQLTQADLANFSVTIKALQDRGYNNSARKYLIWADVNVLCGVGSMSADSSPGQNNLNNGVSYARVDNGCWNYGEGHEIFHALGAVQKDSPHTTGANHCLDLHDQMCYGDGGPVPPDCGGTGQPACYTTGSNGKQVFIACSDTAMAWLYDCNHDDYYSTNPASGSYLATHWNIANSPWLTAATTANTPPPSGTGAVPSGNIVGITSPSNGAGYWLASSTGGIYSYNTSFYGSMGGKILNAPIVGIAARPQGDGYWLVGSDGGIFAFGGAKFFGSTGNIKLNKPIVGITATASGNGYWMVASDGGIFSYGDASFYGSAGATPLNKPIVGMARVNKGDGYWLVASDGGIFSYGKASYNGGTGGQAIPSPIVGMAAGPSTNNRSYWLVSAAGKVYNYGVSSYGDLSANPPPSAVVGMALGPNGAGYWLASKGGNIFPYGSSIQRAQTAGGDGGTLDSVAPSVPTGLATTGRVTTTANLTWNASTDNVIVYGYRIYRNGTELGTSTTTTYSDTTLAGGTTYSYSVAAYDAAGNESAKSSSITVTGQVNQPAKLTVSVTGDISGGLAFSNVKFTASPHDMGYCYGWTQAWQWPSGNNLCQSGADSAGIYFPIGVPSSDSTYPTVLKAPATATDSSNRLYNFSGWGGSTDSGTCSGTSGCNVYVAQGHSSSITAGYTAVNPANLTINVSGYSGTVTFNSYQHTVGNCDSTIPGSFTVTSSSNYGSRVCTSGAGYGIGATGTTSDGLYLTPQVPAGYDFAGWSGTAATCTNTSGTSLMANIYCVKVLPGASANITANLVPHQPATLTINTTGVSYSSLRFTASPHDVGYCAGWSQAWQWPNGSNVCQSGVNPSTGAYYPVGPTTITAPATYTDSSNKQWNFTGWSGYCSGTGGCYVNLNPGMGATVTANYQLANVTTVYVYLSGAPGSVGFTTSNHVLGYCNPSFETFYISSGSYMACSSGAGYGLGYSDGLTINAPSSAGSGYNFSGWSGDSWSGSYCNSNASSTRRCINMAPGAPYASISANYTYTPTCNVSGAYPEEFCIGVSGGYGYSYAYTTQHTPGTCSSTTGTYFYIPANCNGNQFGPSSVNPGFYIYPYNPFGSYYVYNAAVNVYPSSGSLYCYSTYCYVNYGNGSYMTGMITFYYY